MKLPLISEEYRKQQELLHNQHSEDSKKASYGGAAYHYSDMVAELINKFEPDHVLDYGCGKELFLARGLRGKVNRRFKYQVYDPAVPRWSAPPVPADMVVCIDVLEHIEEDCIDDVLDHLRDLTQAIGFFTICTAPALKTLPDGRNAHILQRPPDWWLPRIMCRFDLKAFMMLSDHSFYVIVHSQPGEIEDTDGRKLS